MFSPKHTLPSTSLARQAGLTFERLSKPLLFQRLKEQCNFDRLQRARTRAMKKKRRSDEDVMMTAGGASGSSHHPPHLFSAQKEMVFTRRKIQKIGKSITHILSASITCVMYVFYTTRPSCCSRDTLDYATLV